MQSVDKSLLDGIELSHRQVTNGRVFRSKIEVPNERDIDALQMHGGTGRTIVLGQAWEHRQQASCRRTTGFHKDMSATLDTNIW